MEVDITQTDEQMIKYIIKLNNSAKKYIESKHNFTKLKKQIKKTNKLTSNNNNNNQLSNDLIENLIREYNTANIKMNTQFTKMKELVEKIESDGYYVDMTKTKITINNQANIIQLIEWFKHPDKLTKYDAKLYGRTDIYDFIQFCKREEKVNPDNSARSAAEYAAYFGYLEIIEYFHSHKEPFNNRVIDFAVKGNNYPIVKWLLENRQDGFTYKAMDWAIEEKNYFMVEILNRHNADFSFDSLHTLARKGEITYFDLLIKRVNNISCYYFIVSIQK